MENTTSTTSAVPTHVTRQLIEQQLGDWRTLLESDRIAMAVAEAIGDPETRKEQIRQESTRCVKAIEKLVAMLGELE